MADVSNTMKILALQKILFEETDEHHKLSISEIREKLQQELSTEKIDKKAIKRYLESLEDSGFGVIKDDAMHGKIVYSHQERLFETYELRMLIDAILSARFVNDQQANNIIRKLKELTSKNIARSLPNPIKYSSAMNHIDNQTKNYIDSLHRAIEGKNVITFKYGRYNLDRKFKLNREGREYTYYPYELIWDQGFYYLVGEKDNKEGLSHYRIDRMRNVEIKETTFRRKEIDLEKYMHSTFLMFTGKGEWVEIEFSNPNLINSVIDKFGIEANIKKMDEQTFRLKIKAFVGPGFYTWLRGWGSNAKVISPPSVVKKMKEEIIKINNLYQ